MKPTRLNRWLKPLAILLVIVLIVMLLISPGLTNEQLSKVQPGMPIEQAKELLGEPYTGPLDLGVVTPTEAGFYFTLKSKVQFWKPGVTAEVSVSLSDERAIWIGKNQLLWVQHQDGIVTRTWMFPHTRFGGGVEGCIDSIKEYWIKWTSK